MSSDDIHTDAISWRKPGRSIGNGECIEVGLIRGHVVVRDSKSSGNEIIICSRSAWRSFVARLKLTS